MLVNKLYNGYYPDKKKRVFYHNGHNKIMLYTSKSIISKKDKLFNDSIVQFLFRIYPIVQKIYFILTRNYQKVPLRLVLDINYESSNKNGSWSKSSNTMELFITEVRQCYKSVLVHELTHYLQDKYRLTMPYKHYWSFCRDYLKQQAEHEAFIAKYIYTGKIDNETYYSLEEKQNINKLVNKYHSLFNNI